MKLTSSLAEVKSTADEPFEFNLDNVQIYLEEDKAIIAGTADQTNMAIVYKIDLS